MNLMLHNIKIKLLCVITFLIPYLAHAGKNENLFIKFQLNKNEFYSQEYVAADLWLYSNNPNIQYIKEIKKPYLKNNKEFSYFSQISRRLQPHVEDFNGKTIYVIPIGSFIIKMDKAGKYEFKGGEYEIGLNVPTGYVDPYFGRGAYYETMAQTAIMNPAYFKVIKLPDTTSTDTFSGAVGEFKIKATIPPGDIFVDEDASIIVTLEGKGVLPDDILPEYQDAFGSGNKLKSFEVNSEVYTDGNDIISKKELECVFIPIDINNCKIGKFRFGFFNPSTKKYEIVESDPIDVEVKSSAVKIKPIYI